MPSTVSWLAGLAALCSLASMGFAVFRMDAYRRGIMVNGDTIAMLICSIWSILVLSYMGLGPRFFPIRFSSRATVFMEWLAAVWWFEAFLSAMFGWLCTLHVCSGPEVTVDRISSAANCCLFAAIAVRDSFALDKTGMISLLQKKERSVV
ncbi:hypothetical protein QBC38DRAFT_472905 [Podospora fimiseda]|uniref:MARVEL domain-containing protein n=1 Tax=Podospora fimiseda TaxID=252190 RepID=A0AAN7BUH2_9PEZI|nr:hypothetical protein QBC38DRAFT_472905 [Podospora fimiseda]